MRRKRSVLLLRRRHLHLRRPVLTSARLYDRVHEPVSIPARLPIYELLSGGIIFTLCHRCRLLPRLLHLRFLLLLKRLRQPVQLRLQQVRQLRIVRPLSQTKVPFRRSRKHPLIHVLLLQVRVTRRRHGRFRRLPGKVPEKVVLERVPIQKNRRNHASVNKNAIKKDTEQEEEKQDE